LFQIVPDDNITGLAGSSSRKKENEFKYLDKISKLCERPGDGIEPSNRDLRADLHRSARGDVEIAAGVVVVFEVAGLYEAMLVRRS